MFESQVTWTFQKFLGEGTQGRVFKVLRQDQATGLSQTVAVKILKSETGYLSLTQDSLRAELWIKEFHSLNRIRSKNCVQVLGFERIHGEPALILEYVEGLSLERLSREVWFNNDLLEEILAQTHQALIELTEQGLFHGDLSGKNILVDREGQIKLLDFGFANSTHFGQRFTPRFAAPERERGESPNLASDLYSLAAIEQAYGSQSKLSGWLEKDGDARLEHSLPVVPCHKRKSQLAAKISSSLQNHRKDSTTVLFNPLANKKAWTHVRLNFQVLIVMALIVTGFSSSSQIQNSQAPVLTAHLAIRTHNWHLITINGEAKGETPLTLQVQAQKILNIQYINQNSQGRLSLKLKPGERRTLRDSDFSH